MTTKNGQKGFEYRGGEPLARSVVTSGKWKKQESGFTPRASRMELSPTDTLILSQRGLCQTSDLQNYKKINL